MIYSCQHCGAWFTSEEINKASKNCDAVISCSFCGSNNEFLNPNASRLTRGYSALEEGRFADAINIFTMEIEESEKKRKTPSPDAFLGLALARFGVRVIYDSTDAKRMGDPLVSCWDCNDNYFADDDNFIRALKSFDQYSSSSDFSDSTSDRQQIQTSDSLREKRKLTKIQDHIDTIKDYYLEIKNSKKKGFQYGAFIAFEDNDGNGAQWETVATKMKNALPKLPVFMPPDKSMCDSDLQYEARLLYALHNSRTMLVLIGDNPSTRLRDMYTWYYNKGHEINQLASSKGENLGFVLHNINIPIRVNNKTVDNVFDTRTSEKYSKFVARWNGIITEGIQPKEKEKEPEVAMVTPTAPTSQTEDLYKILDEHHLAFGHYPQTIEKSFAVTNHFQQYEKPDKMDSHGWKVLFRTHEGIPYTWYRDEEVNGEKYRAVYFIKFREKCSVRESKEKNVLQRDHGYVLRKIYCFKFNPIIWDVEKIHPNTSMAVLVSDRGIDCQEYNNLQMDNDWDSCSIHSWLNHEFYDNAFEGQEKKIVCTYESASDDRVFLMDKEEDRMFVDRHNYISGSDYYKCIGGMGDGCIEDCWVTDKSLSHNGEASVMHHTTKYSLDRVMVDNTSVAVLPKIVIALKSGDAKRFTTDDKH
ncbi:MAG: hypothetical protein E7371_03575 [Clostridiales bacterium]|nr:hypothetical protein [Clostridiales bacterium]